MLFNSHEFIFVFLPVTVAGFFAIGVVSRTWALRWIIFTSLFFYAWWRPLNVLIIAPSILMNFGLARALLRLGDDEKHSYARTMVLWLGIAFNVAFLGYFKYTDFATSTINDAFGANLVLTHIILPLGISFITFQKIAFLIDVHAGRVKSFTFEDYCLFVLFFPQLIAGPIVHYREMMPQFHAAPCRFDRVNVAVGLTLLVFGLFKKTVLADNIAPLVTPIYEQAAAGNHISLPWAWMAAIGFTLQIYFDFSGYTDMALGLARFFGVRLPPNFNSPLQASSIIDFWMRWHMTLTRFLTAYIYNPLVISLTRRRAEKGHPGLDGANATVVAFAYLVMFPTLLTFFLAGIWHGAGYGFIVFGLLHGIFLTVNRAWRFVVPKLWPVRARYDQFMKPIGIVLVIIAASTANVFFRSSTIEGALNLLKGMIGAGGGEMTQVFVDRLWPLAGWLQSIGVISAAGSGRNVVIFIWIAILLSVALFCPNTLQILARYEPALGVKPPSTQGAVGAAIDWNTSLPWAIAVSVLAVMGVISLGGANEFLYWQF
jgi:alginate O-acetyltransferase complex protein AlgI